MKTQAYRLGALFVAVVVMAVMLPMTALAIPSGTYQLGSHPGGNQSPPPYGMRLDDLGGSGDVYTFDFSNPLSNVSMTVVQGVSVVISGTVFGGADNQLGGVSAGYIAGTTGLFTLSMTYDTGTFTEVADGGVDDTHVSGAAAHHGNFGSLVGQAGLFTFAGTSFDLQSHAKGNPNTGDVLQLGDTGGSYRGYTGISGWGWLDHQTTAIDGDTYADHASEIGGASDFLFTVVPEPASMILFGSGLLGLAAWRRFRKTV